MSNRLENTFLNRRRFLHGTAATGVGLACGPLIIGSEPTADTSDTINVALLGAGHQGQALLDAGRRIPGVRFQAICDIWEAYSLRRASRILKAYGHPANTYTDYEEMLDSEGDLDAAIIATPDCWHARQAIACLEAGLHVYCEKEMADTIEGARRMVLAARQTGKLLQIGHRRRSNPRYVFCRDKLLHEAGLLGQITAINGQWNRSAYPPLGWPKTREIEQATLERHGYESMHQFVNWWWFKGLGGGPAVYLGSNQIDTYNWFLGARPKSIMASGRHARRDTQPGQWYDTVMVVYEYDTAQGPVNAYYQIVGSNSSYGHFEAFLGDQGTLVMSEASWRGEVYREPRVRAETWIPWIEKGYLKRPEHLSRMDHDLALPMYLVSETPPGEPFKELPYKLPVLMREPYAKPHLENFFDAIRGKTELACPGERGYETAVTVLRINETIEAERKVQFQPEDFVV